MARKRTLLIIGGIALALLAALAVGTFGGRMTLHQIFDSALAVFGVRTAEEPSYQVIDRIGDVEIRRYAPRFAAETTVRVRSSDAVNQAFFILAGYIFGGNKRKQDIAMTAPVATEQSQQIAMTAPVTTEDEADSLTMRFYLPASITPVNAPEPNDPRVTLVEIPEETLATLRFSGGWTESSVAERKRQLLAALQDLRRWRTEGDAFTQFYDPPFTIPFLRRNEVAVRLTPSR